MAINVGRPLATPTNGAAPSPIEVEVEGSEETDGAVIQFGEPAEQALPQAEHGDNLAVHMVQQSLDVLGAELILKFEADRTSRADWERTYTEGIELLGLRIEKPTDPWPGACGAVHPIITEAAVRFQAQAITEIWPASGPCRTKIIGRETQEATDASKRVEDDMNFILIEKMPEYRSETERLLFALPITGSAFKKVYYDEYKKRPVAAFVPAEELVVGYGATDLASCERYTHVLKKTKGEVGRLIRSGFWLDVDLPEPTQKYDVVDEKNKKISGVQGNIETDTRHTILEMYVDLDLKDFSEDGMFVPYVVTIDYSSGKVLAIRRNWEDGDEAFTKRQHLVHYQYIPGIGFYGFGLIHLIGGVAKAATACLRQLVDAGTLATLPAGFKTKGVRVSNADQPIKPGELRDVDVPGDDIKMSIMALPFKEPSLVMFQLMNQLVEEARRLASIPDINVGDVKKETPVGTTMALLERAMKVMTGIQARLHAAMGQEYKLLSVLNVQTWPSYEYDVGEGIDPKIKVEDYAGSIKIVPVSDPNAASMSQRIISYTMIAQQAQQQPQIYDLPELHRQIAEIAGIREPEKIIPALRKQQPVDPVTENMNIISGKPAQVFPHQDHDAHIRVHLAAIQDPKIANLVGQSPMAQAIQGAAESHVREHLGHKYRADLEKQLGVQLPPYGQQLPPEVEMQLSGAMAKGAEKLLARDIAEQILQEQLEAANDPLTEIQRKELEIKERDVARKEALDQVRAHQTTARELMNAALEMARMRGERDATDKKIKADLVKTVMQTETQQVANESRLGLDAARLVVEDGHRSADRAHQGDESEAERDLRRKEMALDHRAAERDRGADQEDASADRELEWEIQESEIELRRQEMEHEKKLAEQEAEIDRERFEQEEQINEQDLALEKQRFSHETAMHKQEMSMQKQQARMQKDQAVQQNKLENRKVTLDDKHRAADRKAKKGSQPKGR